MKIETKYEINQPVWVIRHDKIVECFIGMIEVIQRGKGYASSERIETRYTVKSIEPRLLDEYIATNRIHSTKQEAANAWLIEQGLTIGLTED